MATLEADPHVVTAVRDFTRAVWDSDLGVHERLVALAFADHVRLSERDGHERVWIVTHRIAERTGMSERRARTAATNLVAAGWLRVVEKARQHYSPRYALAVPTPRPAPRAALRDAHGAGLDETGDPRPARHAPRPARGAPRPAPRATESSTPEQNPTTPVGEDETTISRLRSAHGLTADEAGAVLARAQADPDTRYPHRRLEHDGYVRDVLAQVRAARKREAEAGPRCAEHEHELATNCRACLSEVKAGERPRDYVGHRLPPAYDVGAA